MNTVRLQMGEGRVLMTPDRTVESVGTALCFRRGDEARPIGQPPTAQDVAAANQTVPAVIIEFGGVPRERGLAALDALEAVLVELRAHMTGCGERRPDGDGCLEAAPPAENHQNYGSAGEGGW